jgi:hypothetical protein
MPTNPTVEEILAQARLLSLEERAILLEELRADLLEQTTTLLQRIEGQQPYAVADQEYHSIMELKGLGKELWQGINVEKYIEEDRSSWRG